MYAIGVIATVYHFANGLWSLGITWGLWTSPAAMQRANWLSLAVGLGLGAAGLGALGGMRSIDVEKAKEVETRMYKARQMLEGGMSVKSSSHVEGAVGRNQNEPMIIVPVQNHSSGIGDQQTHERN
jgi:succinate dehydrogenase / fumarate reductase cytochrome b subunit